MTNKSDTPGEGLAERLFRVVHPHIGSEFMTRQAVGEIIAVIASDTAGLPSDCAGLVAALNEFVDYYSHDEKEPISIWEKRRFERAREAIAALSRATEAEPVAEVIWYDPRLYDTNQKPHKIIDASMGFFDRAPIGTKLYAAPPAPQPALALIEELERALDFYADPFEYVERNGLDEATPDFYDELDTGWRARKALASAKRFKGA